MAERQPRNKAQDALSAPEGTQTNPEAPEAPSAPPVAADSAPTRYTMRTPDGRAYVTTDQAEAEHLNRTRGYAYTETA